MHAGDAEHSVRLGGERQDEVAGTSDGFRVRFAALDSMAVSVACLWILCMLDPPREATLLTACFYVLLSGVVGAVKFWIFAPRMGRSGGR